MGALQRITLAVYVAMVAAACSWAGNDEHAYFDKRGESYVVELKGRRRTMAHDPLSAVLGRTYEAAFTMQLPRIEGMIDGAEIPVRPGYLRYVGRVVITGGQMKVDLYYDDRAENTKLLLSWNGEYVLTQRVTGPRNESR
jgi:hypothetical protein